MKVLALGVMLGAAGVVALTTLVVALSLLLSATLFVLIGTAFGDARLVWLPLVGLLAALLIALVLAQLLRKRVLPGLRAVPSLGAVGAVGWSAALFGAVLSSSLGAWLIPPVITSSAWELVTGQTSKQRADAPAAEARQRRLQAVVEAPPSGPEAALLAAVDFVAGPVRAPGRVLGEDDTNVRVQALRALQPSLPSAWQPVLLGTLAEVQRRHSGHHPADSAMRDTLAEGGRAGSRALTLLAAEEYEGIAHHHERSGELGLADAAWQLALAGYAAAGAQFEVARLYDETLPARLLALPAPKAAPFPGLDAELSQRLWRFAQALGDDAAWPHASAGQRDLAVMVALIALERAPDAAAMALVNPAQRWATDPWAMGRWVLALRHARGDCAAALSLSDATRQRRRPAVVNEHQPSASSLDLAWALAWAEAGDACADSEDDRRQARARLASLDYVRFSAGELDAARVGVAASLAVLRAEVSLRP